MSARATHSPNTGHRVKTTLKSSREAHWYKHLGKLLGRSSETFAQERLQPWSTRKHLLEGSLQRCLLQSQWETT